MTILQHNSVNSFLAHILKHKKIEQPTHGQSYMTIKEACNCPPFLIYRLVEDKLLTSYLLSAEKNYSIIL